MSRTVSQTKRTMPIHASVPPTAIQTTCRRRNPITRTTAPVRLRPNCTSAARPGRSGTPIMAGNIWWIDPIASSVPHPRVMRWFTASTG